MYWEKDVETLNRAKLEKLQLTQLKDTIGRVQKSFYYGKILKEKGLNVKSLGFLNDINKFPFTTKDDLREHWPYGFIAVPKEELVRMHSSSGTTGRATVVFHTANDIAVLDESSGALYVYGRYAQKRCFSKHDDLRPFYGRSWFSLRRGKNRCAGHSRRLRAIPNVRFN